MILLLLAACAPTLPLLPPATLSAEQVITETPCDASGCQGLIRVGERTARLPEPATPWSIDGVVIQGTALRSVDGDPAPELLVYHQLTEPPRPAVGSRLHEVLSVYNLPELSLALSVTLREAGGNSEPACVTALSARRTDLLAETRCAEDRDRLEASPLAPEIAVTHRRWQWSPQQDVFLPEP